jgi:hypothetical protein
MLSSKPPQIGHILQKFFGLSGQTGGHERGRPPSESNTLMRQVYNGAYILIALAHQIATAQATFSGQYAIPHPHLLGQMRSCRTGLDIEPLFDLLLA